MRASLVVVGNELLSGHTKDANGPYLAGRLAELGHQLARIEIVPDTMEAITGALDDAADRAELVFVCGGLGPTRDDITIQAVAAFLDRELVLPDAARAQIERIYRRGKEMGYLDDDEVDERAWRMARIPEDGIVIRNDEGAAPGSVHRLKPDEGASRTVYVLPGPPAELQNVFSGMVEEGHVPQGTAATVREVHLATFESMVADSLDAVHDACPEVEMGSYPQHGEKRVIVRFTGDEARVQEAIDVLREDLGELEIPPRGDGTNRGAAEERGGPGREEGEHAGEGP